MTEMAIYHGAWSSKEEMAKDFSNAYDEPLHEAMIADVIVAAYEAGGYEGDAFVLFRKDGKLYEVNGSHCSCYGLEGMWEPEEVEPEVLLERLERAGSYGVMAAFKEQIKAALAAWSRVFHG